MKAIIRYTLVIVGLLFVLISQAQFNPDKVCRIENGQLIFSLNLKWSEKERKEVAQLFDLDSSLISEVYAGKTILTISGETWRAKKIKTDIVELTKPILSPDKDLKANDVLLVIDKWANFSGTMSETQETFGFNKFEVANAFLYKNNQAWWFFPGHQNASRVYIAGTFNGWSTTKNPMRSVGTGWTVELNLNPGKYAYKFVVDGRWMPDPSNKLKEDDGVGGYNSVLYCYNHQFELKGYLNAKKVVVTGNFYNWNPKGILMNRTAEGWSLPLYLRDGTYAYKFIVDNQWMLDPANKNIRNDGTGNQNSFFGIGEPYLFRLNDYRTAQKVILTGNFNGWSENELVMDKTDQGWQLPYAVAAGNYEYKYIVDGNWIVDPANPFVVQSNGNRNSFIALKSNHLFELAKYPDAKSVLVTGNFNGWSTEGYQMIRQGNKWIFPLFLKPGKYIYKFIVDGTWILDPENKFYEQNEYNTNNSVLWVEE